MELFLIAMASFGAALLGHISGLGFTMLLIPVFSLFFPIEIAIVMSAGLHFIDSGFRLLLHHKDICIKHLLLFSIFAGPAAWVGASLLKDLPDYTISYDLGWGKVQWLAILIGLLLILMSILNNVYFFGKYLMKKWTLVPIGLLSGFIAGISGLHMLIRKRALENMQLSKIEVVATGLGIAVLVDMSRLPAYVGVLYDNLIPDDVQNILIALFFALTGIIIGNTGLLKEGNKMVKGITQVVVIILAFGILMGLI